MGDPVKVLSVDDLLSKYNAEYETPKELDPWGYEMVDPDEVLGKPTEDNKQAKTYSLPELAPDQTNLGHSDLMPDKPDPWKKSISPQIINVKNEASLQLKDLEDTRKKMSDEFSVKYPMKKVGGLRGMAYMPVSEKDKPQFDKDYKDFQKQLKVIQSAKDYLDNVSKLPEDRADFWDYFKVYGDEFLQDVTTVGYAGMIRAGEEVGPSRRIAAGEGSEADKILLKAKGLLDVGEGAVDRGPGYRFAGMAAQTIPFMESIAMTGGIGGLGKAGLKTALKEGGTLAAAKAGGKFMLKAAGRGAVRAPIMPQTKSMEYMAGNVILDENNDWVLDRTTMDPALKAFAKGTYQNWTAYTSECVGELFGGGLVGGIMKKTGIDKKLIPAWFRTATKAVGLHSIEGEITEEFINNVMDAPINDQSFIEALTTDAWDTIWMTGLFTGILGASAGPGVITNARARSTNMKVINYFGREKITELRKALESGDKEAFNDLYENLISEYSGKDKSEERKGLRESGLTQKQAWDGLYKYVTSLAMQKTYDSIRETGDAVIEEEDKAGQQIDPRVEAIHEVGRRLIFGGPDVSNEQPVVSFADTKLGQKVFLIKQSGEETEDPLFVAYDVEALKGAAFDFDQVKPIMVKQADIMERKDVPYQQWLQSELAEYQQSVQTAKDTQAAVESPFQTGQKINYQGKELTIGDIGEKGIIAHELDEEGIPGQSIEISNEELGNIAQPAEQVAAQEQAQPAQEVPKPQARQISDGTNEYSITPQEDGTFTMEQTFNTLKQTETVVKKLNELYPKVLFKHTVVDSGDPFVPDTYVVTARPKLAPKPAQEEAKPEEPVKEPWTMTQDEYVKSETAKLPRGSRPEYIGQVEQKAKEQHKTSVTEAVSQGKEVPEEIRSSYPELNKEEPTNDQENEPRVSGQIREGEEPEQAEPDEGGSQGEVEGGRILQTQGEVEPEDQAQSTKSIDDAIMNLVEGYAVKWHNAYIRHTQLPYFVGQPGISTYPDLQEFTIEQIQQRYDELSEEHEPGGKEKEPQDQKPEAPVKEEKPKPTDNRKSKILSFQPRNFTEAVLQFFVFGGRISREDFIRHTGYHDSDLNTFSPLLAKRENGGQSLDTFHDALDDSFGMEERGAMDMANEIVEIMTDFPSKARMMEMLEVRYNIKQELPPNEESMAVDYPPDVPITETAPETFNNLADEIFADKEIMSIFTDAEYLDDNGLPDWERINDILDNNPGYFTQFPFGLNENKLELLKTLANDTQQQRIFGERIAERYSDQGQGEGDITDGGTAADQGGSQEPEEQPAGEPAPAEPEVTPEAPAEIPEPPKVTPVNTVFTSDAYKAARDRLKDSRNTLNVGLNPQQLTDAIIVAGYHIESGTRKFAAFAKVMIEDIGEHIKPYLKWVYESVYKYPGFDNKGMDSIEDIQAIDIDNILAPEEAKAEPEVKPEPAPEPQPVSRPKTPTITFFPNAVLKGKRVTIETTNAQTGETEKETLYAMELQKELRKRKLVLKQLKDCVG